MALDEATQQLLRTLAAAPDAVPLASLTPVQARALSSSRATAYAPGPEILDTTNFLLPVSGNSNIRMRIHTPTTTPTSVLLYLHGGGWVIGDLDTYDSLAKNLAHESGATVVLAEYRKAPEFPFPIPVEDAWAAYCWVVENLEQLASLDAKLHIAGDSAGGNLAAVIARRARDAAVGNLASQILIYPVVDHDLSRTSYLERENQTLLPKAAMEYFWGHYAPDAQDRKHQDASPLHCTDLSALPNALIITAEHDVLRDEGEHYALALTEAGVHVEHHRWLGQMHGFIQMVGILPASLEVTRLIARHISENEQLESEA
ncbi:alpha/beta hydrolase [Arthrobacter sp. MYb227]|uniref:alpha/beta hydrolase n=1 Tax=Arthrobacter sp. MYb227 TaxID=1848601 RepID=UPI0015E42C9E|nr:alpha/beta hydrolase [Arthrobacter sp. MYb227]